MKKNVPVRKHPSLTLPMLVMAGLLASSNMMAGVPSPSTGYIRSASDTILVKKQITSKKNKIKLYPNANHQVLFFSVAGETGKVYQLYLFDLEGKLVKQANIRNKQTTILNKIDKGDYIYEVFSDDERIENGQVIVR